MKIDRSSFLSIGTRVSIGVALGIYLQSGNKLLNKTLHIYFNRIILAMLKNYSIYCKYNRFLLSSKNGLLLTEIEHIKLEDNLCVKYSGKFIGKSDLSLAVLLRASPSPYLKNFFFFQDR